MTSPPPLALAALALALGGAGCAGRGPAPTPPLSLCAPGMAAPCREPEEVERLLSDPTLAILHAEPPPHGAQGVVVLTLASRASGRPEVFRAKWRAWSTELGWSSPRKEIALHALQRLLLPPRGWVVPPTRAACFPLADAERWLGEREPTWAGADCVAGSLMYWLEGARSLEEAVNLGWLSQEDPVDPRRMEADRRYERSVADVSLLAHLAELGDGHRQQFVVAGGPGSPRLYLIDASIAFSSFRNPELVGGPWDWSELRAPRLSRASVDRLRALTDVDLDALGAAEQLSPRGDRLVQVAPAAPAAPRDRGVRPLDTDVQIGLTRAEIGRVRRRVRQLVARVDAGRTGTF